ncbi:hypothetical protein BJX62DRAFT_21919 [Aspergillus germanicus]
MALELFGAPCLSRPRPAHSCVTAAAALSSCQVICTLRSMKSDIISQLDRRTMLIAHSKKKSWSGCPDLNLCLRKSNPYDRHRQALPFLQDRLSGILIRITG